MNVTLSGTDGGVIRTAALGADGRVIADLAFPILKGRFGVINYANRTKWLCENSPVCGVISLSFAGVEPDSDGRQFRLLFNFGVSNVFEDPLRAVFEVNPAALLDGLDDIEHLTTTVSNKSTLLKFSSGHLEIDNLTGALISFRLKHEDLQVTGRSGPGLLERQLSQMDEETAGWGNLWTEGGGLAGFAQFAAGTYESLMKSAGN